MDRTFGCYLPWRPQLLLIDLRDNTEHASSEGTRAVATRAEELLRRLRHDGTVIKADPEKRKLALDAEGVSGLKDSVGTISLFHSMFGFGWS